MGKNDIAIIGTSFEFPGSVNLDEFWESLNAGKCLYTNLNKVEPNKVQAWGGVSDLAGFDYRFFGYSYKEACAIDPQHRHLLTHSYLALENSGYIKSRQNYNIGVYASSSINTYFIENLGGNLDSESEDDLVLGNTPDFLATRVAYKLGLTGPAMTIQTGCSSSLVNLHQARIALLTNQCDIALAAAVSLSAPNDSGYSFLEGGIRSKTGEIRPFDNDATGTVFTNGVAVLVLKRYSDALRDDDPIIGVISSSAINNDGDKKASFTAPNVSQQARVIEKAIRIGKIDKRKICLIESHGTGTSLGDPIEFEALRSVFQVEKENSWCALHSVKANVGHMDTVSGFAGILKSCMVLKHRQLPPQIHFKTANKRLEFERSPFYINTEGKSLPDSTKLYAGVTALGIGGTNAHVILTTPDEQEIIKSNIPSAILFAAKDKQALTNKIKDMIKFCQLKPETEINALAATTQFRQEAMPYRFGCFTNELSELITLCQTAKTKEKCSENPNIAFLFPGQGSQYIGMGFELYQNQAFFRNQIDNYFTILKNLTGKDYHSILFSDDGNKQLYQTINTQVVLVAFEVAMAEYLVSLGIKPSVLIGHSLGEYTALVVSGVLDFLNVAKLLLKRASLMSQTESGMMLSVFCDEQTLTPLLTNGIDIAAINTQNLITVSGNAQDIKNFSSKLTEQEIVSQELATEHAFHSYLLDGILEEFAEFVETIHFNLPTIPIISNVTGKIITNNQIQQPTYWVQQIRGAVQFRKGIETIESDFNPHYLEVGPGLTLTTFSKQIITRNNVVCVNSLPHPKVKNTMWDTLYGALTAIWQVGINIRWQNVSDNIKKGSPVALPPYPFTNKRCWIECNDRPLKSDNRLKAYVRVWKQFIPPQITTKNHAILIIHNDSVLANSFKSLIKNTKSVELISWQENVDFPRDVNEAIQVLGEKQKCSVVVINLLALENDSTFNWQIFQQQNLSFLNKFATLIEKQANTCFKKMLLLSSQAIDFLSDVIPEKAVLQSMVKTINQEKPSMACSLIDLGLQSNKNTKYLIEQISQLVEIDKPVLALRNNTLFTETFTEVPEPNKEKAEYSHIAIVGGTGNVGLQYIQALQSSQKIKLTLLQRRDFSTLLKTHNNQALLNKLNEDKNCQFVKADVGDFNSLKSGLEHTINQFGQIDLLIHSAGVDASMHYQLMNNLNDKFIQDSFYAKRQGLINIAALSDTLSIQNIHVVSSISSVLAGIGMYVYASLHAYIDNFVASENKNNNAHWTTINWEAWEFGNTDVEPEAFQQGAFGSHLDSLAMTVEQGRQFIEAWLPLPFPAVIVSSGDLKERYQNWVEKKGFASKPKLIKDERPELTVSFVKANSKESQKLMQIWSDVLGIEQVGIYDNFFELGGHSLMALQLVSLISSSFNKRVSVVDLFTYPTIAKLVEHLTSSKDSVMETNTINKRANSRRDSLKNRKKLRSGV